MKLSEKCDNTKMAEVLVRINKMESMLGIDDLSTDKSIEEEESYAEENDEKEEKEAAASNIAPTTTIDNNIASDKVEITLVTNPT